MKLVVFDLRPGIVAGMVKILRDAGHEVLGISWGGAMPKLNISEMTDPAQVASAIRDFQPDFVFWNHFLRSPEGNSRDIARLSGIPKERSIANSRETRVQHDYCGHRLKLDKMNLEDFIQREDPERAALASRQLLAQLAAIVGESTS